jgi:hypothetical protein
MPEWTCRYFRETGHYVCEEFLEFFDARGQLEAFGYPVSEGFEDVTHRGLWVQYFQRARMEWYPENPAPYQVQLGLLIDELGHSYPPVPPDQIPDPGDPEHRYFPETGHVVSHDFLDAFEEKGGLDIFGYPRSDFVYEDGIVVQYFQRARMEWHRDRPDEPISLTNVGELYLERFPIARQHLIWRDRDVGGIWVSESTRAARMVAALLPLVAVNAEPGTWSPSIDLRRPPTATATERPATPTPTETPDTSEPVASPTPAPPTPVLGLRVSAAVRYPITGPTGTQTVFIYVTDQEQRPLEGATVDVEVVYPRQAQDCAPQPTDGAGFTRCSFDILPTKPGKVILVNIAVTYGDLRGTTQTSFVQWL